MEKCEKGCPDGELCKRLNRHVTGRLWDIWNGVNIDPKMAEKYRTLWERQAGAAKEVSPDQGQTKSGGCGCGNKA